MASREGSSDAGEAAEVGPLGAAVGSSGGAMAAVTDHRQGQTGGWFSVSCRISSLINWKRPFRTSALFAATNTVFWVLAFSPIQAYSLLALSLAAMVVMVTVVDVALSRSRGAHLWHSMTASWEVIDSGQDSRSGPQFSESFKLFLQETSSFKQQNPGKFCLLVCSLCTFFAVLGRYIPGIVISYILVLGIFLWPLISSHDFGLWLKPVLQKLDFGIGEFLQKVKQNHEKRLLQAETETENIEADLSSLFPKLDSTACKEMSVSDTEVSDVTWTDNGTFNLSEGHTPQTENSEDLDREEAFTGGLPEFPSLDNGLGTNGDDDDDLSIGLPAPPPQPQQLIKSKRAPPASREPADHALELVHQMAGDVIAAAVASAIHERIEAAVCATLGADDPGRSKLLDADRLLPLELAEEESDSEVEDFELLDQSELEQLEGELGLGEKKAQVKEEAEAKPGKSSSGGFFSKLLGRH